MLYSSGDIKTHPPKDDYENFVTSFIETTTECIPHLPREKYNIPQESLTFLKKKHKIT